MHCLIYQTQLEGGGDMGIMLEVLLVRYSEGFIYPVGRYALWLDDVSSFGQEGQCLSHSGK